MHLVYDYSREILAGRAFSEAFALMAVASVWFVANTGTLSLAVSLSAQKPLFDVWRKGLTLYLVNFYGSCAAAGILSIIYERTDLSVFLLSIPLAAVLYQLHAYYVQKDQQAQKHITDLNKVYLQTVETLASAVDAKDKYTHGHIRRVQSFAGELANILGITDPSQLMAIKAGALLHDVGKIAIPEYILNKPSALTDSEYRKMRMHPVVGSNMLKHIEFPYPVIPIVKSHHERWDSNGYPDGLSGEDIPIGARILALVDCYDALTTDRPYRSPMSRDELVTFLRGESGKAYDPRMVEAFITNLDRIEAAGRRAGEDTIDIWGMQEPRSSDRAGLRTLQKVQPILTYGKALSVEPSFQAHLYSVFEFATANIQCLTAADVFAFMGRKLEALVSFDAAVFFLSDLEKGVVVAHHVTGSDGLSLKNLEIPLEQKLSGWVASNNQALCNLPPFPDFIGCVKSIPSFEMSAIAPMNRQGRIWGAISLYRREKQKFTDEEFRRVEIVASQTALALSACQPEHAEGSLVDTATALPNGYHLHLLFQQLAVDAQKFDYSFALMVFRVDRRMLRRRWGHAFGEEVIGIAANFLKDEFRENDLLVRYATDEFCAVVLRIDRSQAEGLKTRLETEFNKILIPVRPNLPQSAKLNTGIAMFPEDGTDVEALP
jgi:diguanylate cyclase (GGDEF)-like protein/putative nucleotidyltransferase with HDIG domain